THTGSSNPVSLQKIEQVFTIPLDLHSMGNYLGFDPPESECDGADDDAGALLLDETLGLDELWLDDAPELDEDDPEPPLLLVLASESELWRECDARGEEFPLAPSDVEAAAPPECECDPELLASFVSLPSG